MQRLLPGPWHIDDASIGADIYDLAAELYPICRSITGDGVRQTLEVLGSRIPIEVREVPTGTKVFDWTVPKEWNVREAYIGGPDGRRVADFVDCNLHLMSYSAPVRARMPLDELKKHIFTLPEQPQLIPYRTSYYKEAWGFCMSHDKLLSLSEGYYDVVIDTRLEAGSLTYGEYFHRGECEDEVLLSAHVCHPALANDNCSGLALLTRLAEHCRSQRTRLSYRFLFAPGTIGAIAWLAANEDRTARIKHGLVVSCVGDAGGPTYKRSRRGDAAIDQAMEHVLKHASPGAVIKDFSPYGYDERQFCSPGFNLAVGSFQRSQYGTFPEYHTSADNLEFIAPEHLGLSFEIIARALHVIENDRRLININPKCEPQLGRRGLYSAIGGSKDAAEASMAMLWVLNLSDGRLTLLDIAERAGLQFSAIDAAASLLEQHDLLAPFAG